MKEKNRKIIFEDGQEFEGIGFGAAVDRVCEIVFNTSMAGYQEILSDPSYTDQAVVMTYPLIGNYGMAKEDYEGDVRNSKNEFLAKLATDAMKGDATGVRLGELEDGSYYVIGRMIEHRRTVLSDLAEQFF